MLNKTKSTRLWLALAICFCMTVAASTAWAQKLAANQTNGFGNGRLVTFTYLQNFDCVEQPGMDLDFNHTQVQSDPNEIQIPICQAVTEPTQDPTGGALTHTAHLYVLIPFFSLSTTQDPNDAMDCPFLRTNELCGATLGSTLIAKFGFLPEAWKKKPLVPTQCPDPNNPTPGTCTMHASSVDLSVTLAALGKGPNPPTMNVFVPTPNHSHVVDNSRVNTGPIWWEVRPVLVMDPKLWPAADGSSGITSAKAMDDAEAAMKAIEVGSNFFLFFSSSDHSMMGHMHGVGAQPQAVSSDPQPAKPSNPPQPAGSTQKVAMKD